MAADNVAILWNVQLLGGISVTPGEALEKTTAFGQTRRYRPRGAVLLTYLACAPNKKHPRELLAEELFADTVRTSDPELKRKGALGRLRVELDRLRLVLEPTDIVPRETVIQTDAGGIQLNGNYVLTDVSAFLTDLEKAETEGDVSLLCRAVNRWRLSGSFLPGMDYEWVRKERDYLQERYVFALLSVIEKLEDKSPDLALSYALTASKEGILPRSEIDEIILRLEARLAKPLRKIEKAKQRKADAESLRGSLESQPTEKTRRGIRKTGDHAEDAVLAAVAQLPRNAQRLLFRLCVFATSFTAPAVASVCQMETAPDILKALVRSHLVSRHKQRYYLPEKVRRLAEARLSQSDLHRFTQQHSRWLLQRFQEMARRLSEAVNAVNVEETWKALRGDYGVLEELENLEPVLRFLLSDPIAEDSESRYFAAQLVLLASEFWMRDTRLDKVLYWYDQLWEALPESFPRETRWRLIYWVFNTSMNFAGASAQTLEWGVRLLSLAEAMSPEELLRLDEPLWIHLRDVAVCAHHCGQDALARDLFERALQKLPSSNNDRLNNDRCTTLSLFADALHVQGEREQAHKYYAEAYEIAGTLPDSNTDKVMTVMNYGRFLYAHGELKEAEKCLDEGLNLWTANISRDRPARECLVTEEVISRDFGRLYLSQGRYARAKLSFQRCVDICQEIEHHESASDGLRGLGMVALCLGDLVQARTNFEKGQLVWQENKHERWQAVFCLLLAQTAYYAGNEDESLSLVAAAEHHISQTNAHQSQATAHYLRARIALRQRDLVRSLQLHQKALTIRLIYAGKRQIIESVEGIAQGVLSLGLPGTEEESAFLRTAIQRIRDEAGMPRPPVEMALHMKQKFAPGSWDSTCTEGQNVLAAGSMPTLDVLAKHALDLAGTAAVSLSA